ncbi:hypothetical protein HanIR_Chr09g0437931 [Helianthus annuus]|nr:hypothetical protein HanIR_Chr09g0437931 [Helianthus annuus]
MGKGGGGLTMVKGEVLRAQVKSGWNLDRPGGGISERVACVGEDVVLDALACRLA